MHSPSQNHSHKISIQNPFPKCTSSVLQLECGPFEWHEYEFSVNIFNAFEADSWRKFHNFNENQCYFCCSDRLIDRDASIMMNHINRTVDLCAPAEKRIEIKAPNTYDIWKRLKKHIDHQHNWPAEWRWVDTMIMLFCCFGKKSFSAERTNSKHFTRHYQHTHLLPLLDKLFVSVFHPIHNATNWTPMMQHFVSWVFFLLALSSSQPSAVPCASSRSQFYSSSILYAEFFIHYIFTFFCECVCVCVSLQPFKQSLAIEYHHKPFCANKWYVNTMFINIKIH